MLAYHRVGARTPSPVDLGADPFRRQMEHVSSTAASLDDALVALAAPTERATVGAAPIVVTFDDGTKDFVEVALPILVEFSIPVVLYLSTANVDSGDPTRTLGSRFRGARFETVCPPESLRSGLTPTITCCLTVAQSPKR